MKLMCVFIVGVSTATLTNAAVVYDLVEYDLEEGYSYEGTITTDGTTGLFPSRINGFSSRGFDWSISVEVPTADGVRAESLTPDNSELELQSPSTNVLVVDDSAIFLPVPSTVLPTILRFSLPESDLPRLTLSFASPVPLLEFTGGVSLIESMSSLADDGDFSRTLIAVRRVPEPSTLGIFAAAMIGMGCFLSSALQFRRI